MLPQHEVPGRPSANTVQDLIKDKLKRRKKSITRTSLSKSLNDMVGWNDVSDIVESDGSWVYFVSKKWFNEVLDRVSGKKKGNVLLPIDNSDLFVLSETGEYLSLTRDVLNWSHCGDEVNVGFESLPVFSTDYYMIVPSKSWDLLITSFGINNICGMIKRQLAVIIQRELYGAEYCICHYPVQINICTNGCYWGEERSKIVFDKSMTADDVRWRSEWWSAKKRRGNQDVPVESIQHQPFDKRSCKCFLCDESSNTVDLKDNDTILVSCQSR